MAKVGIKETTELARFGNAVVTAIKELQKRGLKITAGNLFRILPYLLPAFGSAEDAFDGIQLIPAELSNLDKGEKRELYLVIDEGIDLKDPRKTDAAERLLKALLEAGDAAIELAGRDTAELDEE